MLGELATIAKEPVIFKPSNEGRFLISVRGEEELVSREKGMGTLLFVGTELSWIGAVAALLLLH